MLLNVMLNIDKDVNPTKFIVGAEALQAKKKISDSKTALMIERLRRLCVGLLNLSLMPSNGLAGYGLSFLK